MSEYMGILWFSMFIRHNIQTYINEVLNNIQNKQSK